MKKEEEDFEKAKKGDFFRNTIVTCEHGVGAVGIVEKRIEVKGKSTKIWKLYSDNKRGFTQMANFRIISREEYLIEVL